MSRSIVALLVSTLVTVATACIPPSQTGNGDGAAPPSSSSSRGGQGGGYASTGGDGDLCQRACQRFADCGLDQLDPCVQSCSGGTIAADRLELFAASSCEDLQSYMQYGAPANQTGQGCASHGANDCPNMAVCCNGDVTTGTPGQCIAAAICYAPTR